MMSGLIGRDAELVQLRDLLADVDSGGGAVVVRGEPGIGKSTVLAAVADVGRSEGFAVVSATGVEAEAQFPYAGLDPFLRPLRGRFVSLPDVQRHALEVAFGSTEAAAPEPFLQ